MKVPNPQQTYMHGFESEKVSNKAARYSLKTVNDGSMTLDDSRKKEQMEDRFGGGEDFEDYFGHSPAQDYTSLTLLSAEKTQ
mgnify:CR=1 FL=1